MAFQQRSTRSGRYIKQTAGYRAFIPSSVPPDPPINFDDELLDALSRADRAVGRLDGCAETLPDSDLFVYMYIRKEAVLSSQIEGTQASLMDVLEFEASANESSVLDVGDVFNYLSAMDHGLRRLDSFPLSLRLIREIHAKLLTGLRGSEKQPGEFRTSQNWIGPAGCGLRDALFIPPPPVDMNAALDNLEKFLHDDRPMPYLVRAGIAHAQFETIHPFADGNGRIGRLLITFMLCEQRILTKPLLYLSYYFKKHRSEYYDRLQAVRDSGEWEGWLKFFLRGVDEVAEEATTTARKIVKLREKHRRVVADSIERGAGRGLNLLEALYRKPVVSVAHISEICSITFERANQLAKQFSDLGILKEVTGNKRHRLFAYASYLALVGEPISARKVASSGTKKGSIALRTESPLQLPSNLRKRGGDLR